MSDLAPFGAIAQPGLWTDDWAVMSNPFMWDSRSGTEGKQPLFFEIPNDSMYNDSQARMGQEYALSVIRNNLFRVYYDSWHFTPGPTPGHMGRVIGAYESTGPSSFTEAYIRHGRVPEIDDIEIVPASGNVYVNQLVNLTFTSDVDPNHLPMTMYRVDWGDGAVTSVSGIEMRDRPNPDNPHSLYHIYSEACPNSDPSSYCATHNPFNYEISITARDNWGMENDPAETHDVIVRERF